jgi:nicotinamidase/pyrazinamidase
MKFKKALLIVDVQNDFSPGGALGVPEGDKIIPPINKYIKIFSQKKIPIFATRDWHPVKTKHFKDFGGIWPVHCIQNTRGAAFHIELKLPKGVILLYKGMDPKKDSYSSFHAEDISGMKFLNILKRLGIREIYIGGLATDYCIKYSAKDALKNGFKVNVLIDAIKGVNLKPKDSENAIKEIVKMGTKKINLSYFQRTVSQRGGRKNATG